MTLPVLNVYDGQSLAAAVGAAASMGGAEVRAHAGRYAPVKFTSRSAAPIVLISADGPGKAVIVAPQDASAAVQGLGVSNVTVQGFEIVGGRNGVQFSQSGSDFAYPVRSIVIRGNVVHGQVEDGIKVSQGDAVTVDGNTVSDVGQQCVDFVDVAGSTISANDCSGARLAAGIFAKGGSSGVLMTLNVVHDLAGNVAAYSLGGWTDPQFTRPAHRGWEAHGVGALRNRWMRVQAQGIVFQGCVSCSASLNVGDATGMVAAFAIGAEPDAQGRPTTGATIKFNTVTGVPANRVWGIDKRQDMARDRLSVTP